MLETHVISFCPFEFYSAVLFSGLMLKVIWYCASSLFIMLLENLIDGLYYPRNKCDPFTLRILRCCIVFRSQIEGALKLCF